MKLLTLSDGRRFELGQNNTIVWTSVATDRDFIGGIVREPAVGHHMVIKPLGSPVDYKSNNPISNIEEAN